MLRQGVTASKVVLNKIISTKVSKEDSYLVDTDYLKQPWIASKKRFTVMGLTF
jgi:hypothetical protein